MLQSKVQMFVTDKTYFKSKNELKIVLKLKAWKLSMIILVNY